MMYDSLKSILYPLLEDKATGTLALCHNDGKKAEIYLHDGVISGCRNGDRSGEQAAKMVAKWLHIEHDFLEGVVPSERPGTDLDADSYINLLDKIDRIVAAVNELVHHENVRLQMQISELHGNLSLKNYELKVVALLNGKRTVGQVLAESGVAEFDFLYTIYKFHHLGLIHQAGIHEVMEDAARVSFLESIDEKLSDIVGPAAAVLTKEAFRAIGVEEEYLSWREAGKLADAIAAHLDGDEKQVFLDWWLNHPDRRKTIEY